MLTLWLLLESSISKSPYLSRRANVFLPASATLARVSFISRGGLFLVCGCKDRANSKYKPNLSKKKLAEKGGELHSFSHKQDTYMGWKKFQFGGGRWSFLPFKRGVKEDDDRTIKQDEPGGCALKRPTHRAKRPPNTRYIAPIGRRGLPKTRSPRMKYLRGKSIYNNVRAREEEEAQ